MVIGPAYPWAGTEIVCGGYSSPPRGDPLVQNRFSRWSLCRTTHLLVGSFHYVCIYCIYNIKYICICMYACICIYIYMYVISTLLSSSFIHHHPAWHQLRHVILQSWGGVATWGRPGLRDDPRRSKSRSKSRQRGRLLDCLELQGLGNCSLRRSLESSKNHPFHSQRNPNHQLIGRWSQYW